MATCNPYPFRARLRFGLARGLILAACAWLALLGAGAPARAEGLGLHPGQIAVGTRENPLEVRVGIRIDQITAVDRKSENSGAVATLRLRWQDPALAFEVAPGERRFRIFTPAAFVSHAAAPDTIAPGFVVQNQQANRWIHQAVVAISAEGQASYYERSSTTLQAPHFNFTRYPFDRQNFHYEIVSIFP